MGLPLASADVWGLGSDEDRSSSWLSCPVVATVIHPSWLQALVLVRIRLGSHNNMEVGIRPAVGQRAEQKEVFTHVPVSERRGILEAVAECGLIPPANCLDFVASQGPVEEMGDA